jgi:hypothetical protein
MGALGSRQHESVRQNRDIWILAIFRQTQYAKMAGENMAKLIPDYSDDLAIQRQHPGKRLLILFIPFILWILGGLSFVVCVYGSHGMLFGSISDKIPQIAWLLVGYLGFALYVLGFVTGLVAARREKEWLVKAVPIFGASINLAIVVWFIVRVLSN